MALVTQSIGISISGCANADAWMVAKPIEDAEKVFPLMLMLWVNGSTNV